MFQSKLSAMLSKKHMAAHAGSIQNKQKILASVQLWWVLRKTDPALLPNKFVNKDIHFFNGHGDIRNTLGLNLSSLA